MLRHRAVKHSASYLAFVCPHILPCFLSRQHRKETGKLFPGRLCLWIGAESVRQRWDALSTTRSPTGEQRRTPATWKAHSCPQLPGTKLYICQHKKVCTGQKPGHVHYPGTPSRHSVSGETSPDSNFPCWITWEQFENRNIWNLTFLWDSTGDICLPARAPLQCSSTYAQ